MEIEERQKAHYDRIACTYAERYSDRFCVAYREKFIHNPMAGNLDLSGLAVLEAMCGSGQSTEYLLRRGAKVTGLDISRVQVGMLKEKFPRCGAVCGSILQSGFPGSTFDCVFLLGGLHHLHPQADAAVDEIHRILKPGGYFCFTEPHAGSLPDFLRKMWYRWDNFFERSEKAIDLEKLLAKNSGRFEFIKTQYVGNVAYAFVFQSSVMRIPFWMKRFYASLLLSFESSISGFQSKRFSCAVICQWKKIP